MKQLTDLLNRIVCGHQQILSVAYFLLIDIIPDRNAALCFEYRMLENEEMPGWLAEVNAGATKVWENWDGEASRNYYSPGAVCEWLFKAAGGICVDGENYFHIEPVTGGNLRFVECSYKSMYGEVRMLTGKKEWY